jgi:hypothetical protein
MDMYQSPSGTFEVQAGLTALLRRTAQLTNAPVVILERRTSRGVAVACAHGIDLDAAATLTKGLGDHIDAGFEITLVKPIVDSAGASRARLWILDRDRRSIDAESRAGIASIAHEIAGLL